MSAEFDEGAAAGLFAAHSCAHVGGGLALDMKAQLVVDLPLELAPPLKPGHVSAYSAVRRTNRMAVARVSQRAVSPSRRLRPACVMV